MDLLMLSPYFAPYSGVGALRMTSLAEFLGKRGHNIFVLCWDDKQYPEAQRLLSIPEHVNITHIKGGGRGKERWNLYYQEAKRIIEKKKIQIILCTGGPFEIMKIPYQLKKELGIKYALDFRDLWNYDERIPENHVNRLKVALLRIVQTRIEKKLIKEADSVIYVSENCRKKMGMVLPQCKEKMKVIWNGFDDKRLEKLVTQDKSENQIVLSFLGKLAYYDSRRAEVFLTAVKELIESGREIFVQHIGEEEEETVHILNQIQFPAQFYSCTGSKSYEQGVSLLRDSTFAGVIVNYTNGCGTKIFDYIYTNKPIIALAPPHSEIENLLSQFENYAVCSNSDEVKAAIKNFLDKGVMQLEKNGEKRMAFSRSYQNALYEKNLVEMFDKK